MIGQLLDRRYQITQRLSSGGFGETYLAKDTRIPGHPLCVVKQLKPASTNPGHVEKARQLFNREAEALAQLGSYEQIPRLLAYFTEADQFYLVQEFVEGQTLEAELASGERWLEPQVIQLLEEVLAILIYVHGQGVIHRDIKPGNIIRRQSDNKLVLIDFGAIKQVRMQPDGSGEFTIATPGTRIGTIGYMPTEQARGKPRPSSDLYALGMIAIQALTGFHPTQLEDDSQTGETRWQHVVQVNPGLVQILNKMTRYHFRDRYQTAAEALQAVQVLAQGHPPTEVVKPVAPPERVHELTLEWAEAGQLYTQVIYPQQPSKHPDVIRVGRDPSRCDIVLSDITVSGLHIELFFNLQDQHFYVRNLRQTNPPLVNGQPLPTGERQLHQWSTLQLGQVELRVASIAVKQYPPGYLPNIGLQQPALVPEPLVPTKRSPLGVPYGVDDAPAYESGAEPQGILTPASPNAEAVLAQSEYPVAQPPRPLATKPDSNTWLLWIGVAVVSGVIGAIAFYENDSVITGALIGACLGVGQWFILRQWLPAIVPWIVASVLAEAISFALVETFPILLIGVGVLPGLAQWLVLQGKVRRASWWIVARSFADPIALLVGFWAEPMGDVISGGLAGLISGAITGGVIVWLLRRLKVEPA
ncbi:MAG: serine/threonine-protein kinase [Elainellaceae cyanobacterium]